MNATFYKIERIFQKHEAKNTILKDVMWRIYMYMFITIIIELVSMHFLWEYKSEEVIFIIEFVPFIFLTSLFLLDINRYAKKQLRQKGLKTSDNFFTLWPSSEYREKKEKDIFEDIKNTFFSDDRLKNIAFLNKYSKLFMKQSRQNPFITLFKSVGGIYMLFIIPFWSHLLDIFMHKDTDLSSLKFAFYILVLILLTIAFFSVLSRTIQGLFFRKQERWKYISKELENYHQKLEDM